MKILKKSLTKEHVKKNFFTARNLHFCFENGFSLLTVPRRSISNWQTFEKLKKKKKKGGLASAFQLSCSL